jgi:glycosyltransferase involved in cell wall biosynthesis
MSIATQDSAEESVVAPRLLRPRVLFVGGSRYDLPLRPGLARKWAAVDDRIEPRVIGRAGEVAGEDPRFRLVRSAFSIGGPAFYASLVPAVAAEIRRFRPDAIIAQSPYEALACLAAARGRLEQKLIVEVHGDWRTAGRLYGSRFRQLYAGLADRAALLALRRADATRALTPFTAALAEDATGHKPVAIFPTYFDLGSFTADPPRPLPARPAVVWVGVLQRYKDPRLLAEAWRIVAPRCPGARLVVVGRGPLRNVIDELVHDFPIQVRAEPRLEPRELARLLDESTLLAMSSKSEGMGRVILEAFARGRPVVSPAVGGIQDLVEPDRNGLLVEPGNPEQLAAALIRVLSKPDLAERLAGGATRDGQRLQWTPEGYADAVREMVVQVLAGADR